MTSCTMEQTRIWNLCVEEEPPAFELDPLCPGFRPFPCSLISISIHIPPPTDIKKKKQKGVTQLLRQDCFSSTAEVIVFLLCWEGSPLISCPGLAIYFSVHPPPMRLSFSLVIHHRALILPRVGWDGKLPFPPPSPPMSGSLICQARQEGGFRWGADLCRALPVESP